MTPEKITEILLVKAKFSCRLAFYKTYLQIMKRKLVQVTLASFCFMRSTNNDHESLRSFDCFASYSSMKFYEVSDFMGFFFSL